MVKILHIQTSAINNQNPGTSGLRKKTIQFKEKNYLQNYIQAIFNATDIKNKSIIIGGDGRYFNLDAIQIIISQAIANSVSKIYVAKDGFLSTPAASNIIIKYKLDYGIILSASHNPGGINGDFGIKLNGSNGAPASQILGEAIYLESQKINEYKILDDLKLDISQIKTYKILNTSIEVIDGIKDYVLMLKEIFDFNIISNYLHSKNKKIVFNSFCGISGPYAKAIFVNELKLPQSWLLNNEVKKDFGNLIPDPNPHSAKNFMEDLYKDNEAMLGCACDADGDRNFIFSKNNILEPSDSLAIILQYAHLIPYYKNIFGVARSKPTSGAIDLVAKEKNIPLFITPVGWKFFANLLDNNLITFCGEESFGLGSSHIREKDGLWAIIFYLHIMAITNKSLDELINDLWKKYGRFYFCRQDYENLDSSLANKILDNLQNNSQIQIGKTLYNHILQSVENFEYTDITNNTKFQNQGLILNFNNASVVIRASGTGTSGSTIRIYYSQYEKNDINQNKHIFLQNLKNYIEQIININLQPNVVV